MQASTPSPRLTGDFGRELIRITKITVLYNGWCVHECANPQITLDTFSYRHTEKVKEVNIIGIRLWSELTTYRHTEKVRELITLEYGFGVS